MIKVGRSLSQLVDSKRTRESSGGRRGGSVVNPQKSFFSFEKQGIRKSLKGDRTDSYQGPKFSHISLTPKSAVTIQPPKKVGLFFLSFFLLFFLSFLFFSSFPFISFVVSFLLSLSFLRSFPCATVRSLFGVAGAFGSQGRSHMPLDRARAVSAAGGSESLMLLRNESGFHE